MKGSRARSDLRRLEQINRDQRMLIQILCNAYNSPSDRSRLFLVIQDYVKSIRQEVTGSERLTAISTRIKHAQDDPKDLERIQELEQQIREQDAAYRELEDQLARYNEQARKYEEKLKQNEEEKAHLLDSFRRNQDASFDSTELREKELKALELSAEAEKIKKKNLDAKNLVGEIRDKLNESLEEVRSLQKQVSDAKIQLDDDALKEQIAEQDNEIETLNREIEEANSTIAKLKRENQALREKLMADSDSESTE